MSKADKTIFFLTVQIFFLLGSFFWAQQITFAHGRIFISVVTLLYLCLIFAHFNGKNTEKIPGPKLFLTLFCIVLSGTLSRLWLAYFSIGNHDTMVYPFLAKMANAGQNPYALTEYAYSPIWFYLLGAFGKIEAFLKILPFHFIVKSFLSLVDLASLFILLRLAGRERISLVRTALFFYLNPISFLLTGFHDQIENLALLPLLAGIELYQSLGKQSFVGKAALWAFSTLGMIVKHSIFYEVIICLNASVKRLSVRFVLLLLSGVVLCLFFAPFWPNRDLILRNIFQYASHPCDYGMSLFFGRNPQLKYLFLIGTLLFPFAILKKDLLTQSLLGLLFFMTFTTGIAIQYFVLPIALGALRPSLGFLFYSFIASLFILASGLNMGVPFLGFIPLWSVWLAVLYWFVTELFRTRS